jgi:type III pantothenate kinase
MTHFPSIYALDIGNTRAKLALFVDDALHSISFADNPDSLKLLLTHGFPIVVSNVSHTEWTDALSLLPNPILDIQREGNLPFHSNYASPKTLGMDRICNIAALCHPHQITQNRLVIDIGTCVKMDFIDENNTYLGGSIAPGIQLQLNALHDYTAQLPKLSPEESFSILLGNDTHSSMQSGVMGGIHAAIQWRITEFNNRYQNLQVYMTGGDAHYFDLVQKNNIFVDENLTLRGIYALYKIQSLPI